MSTGNFDYGKFRVGISALSFLPLHAAVWASAGISISPIELLGILLGIATIVGVFTWALRSGSVDEPPDKAHNESKLQTSERVESIAPVAERLPSPAKGKSERVIGDELKVSVPLSAPPSSLFDGTDGWTIELVEEEPTGTREKRIRGSEWIPPLDWEQPKQVPHWDEPAAIPLTRQHESSRGKARELRWYGKGESVMIGTFRLTDPMVYVSDGPACQEEASCVDLTLPIGDPVNELTGGLGYYPSYSRLSPNQRANYLGWLSRGRREHLDDIGYAFLFFYGLERRLLIEKQDLSPIIKEVVRLLETYPISGSFDGYLSRFMAFVLARAGIETLKDKWFHAVFGQSRLRRDEDFLAVALAWFFRRNAPVPVSWALRLVRQDPRSPRSVVIDRLPEQFNLLFEKRYREQFGDGLILRAAKRDRTISYRPASSSLLGSDWSGSSIESIKIPNVMGIQSQFSPLVELWSFCIEELRPLSRVVAKGMQIHTRDAFESLPDELKAEVEHPDKVAWDREVAEHTDEDGCSIVEVAKLASIHGFGERAKLTAKQSQSLARTAQYVGLVIEPDARITNRPYSCKDLVSLLRTDDKPSLPADSRYHGASLMLELGMYIAASDGQVDDEEVDQIARFLESQFRLDPPDARRLQALKSVFLRRSPSITGLGKRLQKVLNRDQRESLGSFLTGIAAANGIIARSEVTALRNAYRALDIDVEHLNRSLEEFRLASQEPVEIQGGDETSERGERIPARPQGPRTLGFRLDENLVGQIMRDTQEVGNMLRAAMLEEALDGDPEVEPVNSVEVVECAKFSSVEDPRLSGLDGRFHAILTELLTRPLWTRTDFDSLVRRHQLMPGSTCESINEWADDLFSDQLILEQGEDYAIQSQLLESKP